MARRRQYLVRHDLLASEAEGFAQAQEERYAGCPEAALYTDEEAQEFLAVSQYLDTCEAREIVKCLRAARIAYPLELAFDEYRLGRYLLRRWGDKAVREAFLRRGMGVEYTLGAALRRRNKVEDLLACADQFGPPATLFILRRYGLADRIPTLLEALSPDQIVRLRVLTLYGKVTMHRFITEPEPPRRPSRWEQQKLLRRIRLRDVQLRAMNRSIRQLGQERKVLATRLRAAQGAVRRHEPRVAALASELDQIRREAAAAERRHQAALAKQALRYRAAIAGLEEQLSGNRSDYDAVLRGLRVWLPGGRE